MLDWLRLIRASGLATIASNCATMALFAFYTGEGLDPRWFGRLLAADPVRILWLLLASCLLYATGMAWNDLADVERDRIIHPQRPLPSGRLHLPTAMIAAALMGVGAVVAALLAEGPLGALTALTVLALALLYDFEAKHIPWLGSLVMGLTRAAHACFALLLLGPDTLRAALVAEPPPGARWLLAYPLILLLYTWGLTAVSELEHRPGRRWELIAAGMLLAAGIALALNQFIGAPWQRAWMLAGGPWPLALAAALLVGFGAAAALTWTVGRPLVQAVAGASRAGASRTLVAGLGGIVLLDAVVASAAHPLGGVLVLLLWPVFRAAGAAIRMD
jgi:4-hydroxybenzoate polyprenyltransferase